MSSAATPELEAVLEEVRQLREAGDALAEAAHRISATYDGVHRLRLALAGWYTALANEWGRADRTPSAAQGQDEDRWTDEARWQYVLYLIRTHAAPEERAHLAAWLNERRFAEVKTDA